MPKTKRNMCLGNPQRENNRVSYYESVNPDVCIQTHISCKNIDSGMGDIGKYLGLFTCSEFVSELFNSNFAGFTAIQVPKHMNQVDMNV